MLGQADRKMTEDCMVKPDSLIFDMDGTLWDNVDSYAISWNRALEAEGYSRRVNREELLGLMGREARVMLETIIPDASRSAQDRLFDGVVSQYQLLVSDMKPHIYEGVYAGLEKLSSRYPLFLLSNCEKGGLVNFMKHTGTAHLFTDFLEHGENLKPKSYNMRLLKERNQLQAPFYIGDTDSDSKASAEAGLPFVFVTYGFGKTENFICSFDSFPQLVDYFLHI